MCGFLAGTGRAQPAHRSARQPPSGALAPGWQGSVAATPNVMSWALPTTSVHHLRPTPGRCDRGGGTVWNSFTFC